MAGIGTLSVTWQLLLQSWRQNAIFHTDTGPPLKSRDEIRLTNVKLSIAFYGTAIKAIELSPK
jgi:hypothetical protein